MSCEHDGALVDDFALSSPEEDFALSSKEDDGNAAFSSSEEEFGAPALPPIHADGVMVRMEDEEVCMEDEEECFSMPAVQPIGEPAHQHLHGGACDPPVNAPILDVRATPKKRGRPKKHQPIQNGAIVLHSSAAAPYKIPGGPSPSVELGYPFPVWLPPCEWRWRHGGMKGGELGVDGKSWPTERRQVGGRDVRAGTSRSSSWR